MAGIISSGGSIYSCTNWLCSRQYVRTTAARFTVSIVALHPYKICDEASAVFSSGIGSFPIAYPSSFLLKPD